MRREEDVRLMLLSMGLGEIGATLAIPYMFFLPRTTDPAAQGVQVVVRGVQKGLRELGAPVGEDGWLGPNTARALLLVSGDGWYDKTWMQIYGDVIEASKEGYRVPMGHTPPPPAAQPKGLIDLVTSPVGLVGLAAAGWFLFVRKK